MQIYKQIMLNHNYKHWWLMGLRSGCAVAETGPAKLIQQ